MALLTPEILAYVGVSTEWRFGCDPVEQGAVRRFAQAVMDDDPHFGPEAPTDTRYGGPVAPPLFPNDVLRRPFGAPDPIQERAHDPHFDGTAPKTGGLPPIEPLKGFAVLNGGAEFEVFRYARHGERVKVQERYAEIREKDSAKGPMLLVTVEAEYRTEAGELLLKARRTVLRRAP